MCRSVAVVAVAVMGPSGDWHTVIRTLAWKSSSVVPTKVMIPSGLNFYIGKKGRLN